MFNEPRTAFVARFIGGHNVIATRAGPIAVRADRLILRRPTAGRERCSIDGVVRSVEYQGTYVQLAHRAARTAARSPRPSDEATFDQTPFNPGDTDRVSPGANSDVHHLSHAA